MNRRNFSQLIGVSAVATGCVAPQADDRRPNVLIIHTDEHNFRTLGCYRKLLSKEQAYVWGDGVKVETPNIDALARDGALCTNYYASSPVCTPSRASFVSGLYPQATGSPSNDRPLNDDIITFAELFRRNGYATSYVGKWHLDGEAKPGFSPARKFGFEDNRYMINQGHWKKLKDTPAGPAVGSRDPNGNPSYDLDGANEQTYTTDFLTDRAIRIMDRDKTHPFCLMLSIPDPHGPNTVREPYASMFDDIHFEHPRSMDVELSTMPKWAQKKPVKELKQDQLRAYFGMVKCIDDNVGKLLTYLASQGLDKNTIVVFTADHGDLMGEHKRHNKGVPFEASAKIPFIIRYPDQIPAGKIIKTAHCNTDFAPMILSMAGLQNALPGVHGMDTSAEFQRPDGTVSDKRIVYIRHAGGKWVAATDGRHKLVLSTVDEPWLFDLINDPDELVNVYLVPSYRAIATNLKEELFRQMEYYRDPYLETYAHQKPVI